MGNVTAIGSDLTLDVAESIIDKFDSGKSTNPVKKFENELKQLEQKSKLYYEKTKLPSQKIQKFSFFPFIFERPNSLTMKIINMVNKETWFVIFEKVQSSKFINFFEDDLVLYVHQGNDSSVSIFELEIQKSDQDSLEINDKTYLAKKVSQEFPLQDENIYFRFFRFNKNLAISSDEGLKMYDEKTGELLSYDLEISGRVIPTLNEEYLYLPAMYWYNMGLNEMTTLKKIKNDEFRNTMIGFQTISNNGEYLLKVDYGASIIKVYQMSMMKTDLNSLFKKSIIEFSLINNIVNVNFSYDSNYVIVICWMDSSCENYELFIFSIEEKKFVLYVPDSKEEDFFSYENYLFLGNTCDDDEINAKYMMKLHIPDHKIKSIKNDHFRDLQFKFE
eukprot:gene4587-7971_t